MNRNNILFFIPILTFIMLIPSFIDDNIYNSNLIINKFKIGFIYCILNILVLVFFILIKLE